eukprot:scaffold211_cov168-Ochromonas_danica.AAC.10
MKAQRFAQHSSTILRTFSTNAKRNVVIVDGVRIPFTMAGTVYKDLLAVDLARLALRGLLNKTALDPALIDYIYMGTVIQESRTSNIAREAALGAGIPIHVPAHTISQACISANQAITCGAEKIISGQADIVVAGGAETFSDTPAIANYTTGEVMGHSSDRLAQKFGVTRREQDEFTVLSHKRAAEAHGKGLYKDEIIPVDGNIIENGIKSDTSYEKVSKLPPAFIKPHGTHTAANSSYLTDGAAATLIMSEEKALSLGFKPKAYLRTWTYVGTDPFEELLLGPTFGTRKVLDDLKLSLSDIGVIEFHEAFAGQVLANLNAMSSEKFAEERLGGKHRTIGRFPIEKMNTLGGSLAVGHPFGATGSRLVNTAANRLQREGQRFALLAACADGGLAHAAILERYDNK